MAFGLEGEIELQWALDASEEAAALAAVAEMQLKARAAVVFGLALSVAAHASITMFGVSAFVIVVPASSFIIHHSAYVYHHQFPNKSTNQQQKT